MTREQMIDEAVRRATHATERRVLLADFERLGGWPSFSEHVIDRIRAEFRRMSDAR